MAARRASRSPLASSRSALNFSSASRRKRASCRKRLGGERLEHVGETAVVPRRAAARSASACRAVSSARGRRGPRALRLGERRPQRRQSRSTKAARCRNSSVRATQRRPGFRAHERASLPAALVRSETTSHVMALPRAAPNRIEQQRQEGGIDQGIGVSFESGLQAAGYRLQGLRKAPHVRSPPGP